MSSGRDTGDYQFAVKLPNDYTELAVTGAHAVAVDLLPPIHKDPLIASWSCRPKSKGSRY